MHISIFTCSVSVFCLSNLLTATTSDLTQWPNWFFSLTHDQNSYTADCIKHDLEKGCRLFLIHISIMISLENWTRHFLTWSSSMIRKGVCHWSWTVINCLTEPLSMPGLLFSIWVLFKSSFTFWNRKICCLDTIKTPTKQWRKRLNSMLKSKNSLLTKWTCQNGGWTN